MRKIVLSVFLIFMCFCVRAEVVNIQSGKFNSIIIVFESDENTNKDRVLCNVFSSDRTVIGMGVADRETDQTRIMVGLSDEAINDIIEVSCELQ